MLNHFTLYDADKQLTSLLRTVFLVSTHACSSVKFLNKIFKNLTEFHFDWINK